MADEQDLPIDRLSSARDLPLEEQADCLLAVIREVIEFQTADSDALVEGALSSIDARQMLRQTLESLCRPLSKEQVRELCELTILKLCDRATSARAET